MPVALRLAGCAWLLAWLPSAAEESLRCGGADLGAWTWTSQPMPGYSVLCFRGCAGGDETCRADGQVSLDVYVGGMRPPLSVDMPRPASLLALEEELEHHGKLDDPRRRNLLKAALSKSGKWKGLFGFYAVPSDAEDAPTRIRDAAGLDGTVLAYEAGAFLWPGVEIGFERHVRIHPKGEDGLSLTLLTRSLQPLVIEVSSFLQPSECTHIIKKAMPHVASSPVSHMDHDVGKPDTNWRSSSQWFMPSDDDVTKRLDTRVSALTVVPVRNQEYAQVLRYEQTQRYAAHHDYFDPNMYKKNKDIMALTKKGLFNRMATVFFYLSNVTRGGETCFPRAGDLEQPRNFEDCSLGVSVKPLAGRIIIFYSLFASGRGDPLSLHGGCAVEDGTKWSVNKWIWNSKMNFLRDP